MQTAARSARGSAARWATVICVLLLVGVLAPPAGARALTAHAYRPLAGPILNPERGFHIGTDCTDPSGVIPWMRSHGYTIARCYARLDAFRNRPLTAAFLRRLDAGFANARSAGIKLVLRFTYNMPTAGYKKMPDAPLALVLTHIRQLSPVLHKNADVLAVLQAGFIGAWGEWHDSANHLDRPGPERRIFAALLAATPSDRYIQLRTPMEIQAVGGARAGASFAGASAARIGHHNDCFLGTFNDSYTYSVNGTTRLKPMIEKLGRYAPIGGEPCSIARSARATCANAVAEMRRLHYSYFNDNWEPHVLARWHAQGCWTTIRDLLGYRLQVTAAAWTPRTAPGGNLTVRMKIRNVGFANIYNYRPALIVLQGPGGRVELPLAGVDVRRFGSGTTTTVQATVHLPASLAKGKYRMGLWLPDAAPSIAQRPEYAVRLATRGVWDAKTGVNVLTSSLRVG